MKWSAILKNWKKGNYPTFDEMDKAFLWRTSPLSQKRDLDFQEEMKIDRLLHTKGKKQNYKPFDSFFEGKEKYAVARLNLSGDAMMVVPVPKKGRNFANIYNFLIEASEKQQKKLWKLVAETAEEMLKEHDYIWISTHGHGVNYLHVRLCITPKYYQDSKLRFTPV